MRTESFCFERKYCLPGELDSPLKGVRVLDDRTNLIETCQFAGSVLILRGSQFNHWETNDFHLDRCVWFRVFDETVLLSLSSGLQQILAIHMSIGDSSRCRFVRKPLFHHDWAFERRRETCVSREEINRFLRGLGGGSA